MTVTYIWQFHISVYICDSYIELSINMYISVNLCTHIFSYSLSLKSLQATIPQQQQAHSVARFCFLISFSIKKNKSSSRKWLEWLILGIGQELYRMSPGWGGSVYWVRACEPKSRWFNSQSGHMPGLQARSQMRNAQEATTHWCFSSALSPALPLSLKINK